MNTRNSMKTAARAAGKAIRKQIAKARAEKRAAIRAYEQARQSGILWQGASLIDGAPIVVIATNDSKNSKTA